MRGGIKIRIGQFSKRHNVTQSTVRHYIDIGLLTAKKVGGQYIFSEHDDSDMAEIIKLKNLGFNLAEILKLLTNLRLSGIETDTYKNNCLPILENKKEDIKKLSKKFEKMNSDLDELIIRFREKTTKKISSLGFPIMYLGLIKCPDCGDKLHINNGIIENNVVTEGNIKCKCGYFAVIEDGIFIETKSIRKRLIYGKPMPSAKEYLNTASPEFINFVYSGMIKMAEEINKCSSSPRLILELDHCVGYFLKHYIKYLPQDTTYILNDFDIDKIVELKKALEFSFNNDSFIFFCCDIERIPLPSSSIDVIADHWMTKDYGQTNGKFLLNEILPLLKSGGFLIGAYPFFNRKDLLNMSPETSDYYNKNKIIENLNKLQIKQLKHYEIGPVIEDNPYNYDVSGKELYQAIFVGKKEI